MIDRVGQTWRLDDFKSEGFVVFTVVASGRKALSGVGEVEHNILVLDTEGFEEFSVADGGETTWWEFSSIPWEVDPLYTRLK